MKIASIHLQNFKRFTDLKIENIPATAKLVVLLGPNGYGKSSVFEALHKTDYSYKRPRTNVINSNYYPKVDTQPEKIDIKFYNPVQSEMKKAIYVRTAYRNDPVIKVDSIQNPRPAIDTQRFGYMIENDAAATDNYQRLISNALEHAFRREDRKKSLADFQDETFGEVQDAMRQLFPDLVLNGLGNPANHRSFTFDKGTSSNFLYQNLSGGGKSRF